MNEVKVLSQREVQVMLRRQAVARRKTVGLNLGRCCDKAHRTGCVCEVGWDCPVHGEYHSRSKRRAG